MTASTNRRHWLKSTGLLTAGLFLGPSITKTVASTNKWNAKPRIWEQNLKARPDMSNLRARLLANENPYGPSAKTKVAIMESVTMGNRYGHQDAAKLIEMIAEKEGVTPDHVLLGPGSTDILEKTAIVAFLDGGNVVSGDPAYMSLIKTALAFRAEWKNVPLTADFSHDLDNMYAAIDDNTKLVYICNPNNPTGSITNAEALKKFCAKAADKSLIFVDEAYLEFLDEPDKSTMVGLVKEGKNLLVTRTFSKIHGMAGIRVGYTIGLPETLEKIKKMVRSNMGLNVTALKGAMASLNDHTFQQNSRIWTKETREFTFDQLKQLGYNPIPSYTSFMIFPLGLDDGEAYLGKMFEEGIGVRVFMIDEKPWCRVSMGTMKEMGLFIESFKKVVG